MLLRNKKSQDSSLNIANESSPIEDPNEKGNLWKILLKYATGKRGNKVSEVITRNLMKNKIVEVIKTQKGNQRLLLENFNIFKSLLFQTLIYPKLAQKSEVNSDEIYSLAH